MSSVKFAAWGLLSGLFVGGGLAIIKIAQVANIPTSDNIFGIAMFGVGLISSLFLVFKLPTIKQLKKAKSVG